MLYSTLPPIHHHPSSIIVPLCNFLCAPYLQLTYDRSRILVRLRLSTQIASERLPFCQRAKDGLLDLISVLVQVHVPQHHDGAEKQRGRISKRFAGDVGCGAVYGFEDRAFRANIAGGGKAKAAYEAGRKIGETEGKRKSVDEEVNE